MSKPALHDPLDFGWPWRRLEDAECSNIALADGRRELRIWHEFLPGLTLDMLAWWFQNLDGRGHFRGMELAYYRLWHPRDHINVTATRGEDGRVGPGGSLHIQEAFGRNLDYLVDESPTIHRLDRNGIGLHVNMAGHRVMELDHVFRGRPDGVIYESCMRIGASVGPLKVIIDDYALPRRFDEHKAQAWLRHNVEEVGCFVHFLPELYAQATGSGGGGAAS